MEKFIYTNNKSISKELCNKIINMFENDSNNIKHDGLVSSGLRKDIKDTLDLHMPRTPGMPGYDEWNKIQIFLTNELIKNTKEYYTKILHDIKDVKDEDNIYLGQMYNGSLLENTGFMIQKYNKQKGKYVYHDDFDVDWKKKSLRHFTYLWYLNTVDEGGETEFWGTHKIKPEAGKLILFPSSWTFPHRGKMPLSHDKYIIIGWTSFTF
jgi:hypothetical protein